MARKQEDYPVENDIASELAESWMNGNWNYVVDELKDYRPLRAALVAILLCDKLPAKNQQLFADYLAQKA